MGNERFHNGADLIYMGVGELLKYEDVLMTTESRIFKLLALGTPENI